MIIGYQHHRELDLFCQSKEVTTDMPSAELVTRSMVCTCKGRHVLGSRGKCKQNNDFMANSNNVRPRFEKAVGSVGLLD